MSRHLTHLKRLEAESIHIMREVMAEAGKQVAADDVLIEIEVAESTRR